MVIIIYGGPQGLIFKDITKTMRKKLIMSRSRRVLIIEVTFILQCAFHFLKDPYTGNENFKKIGVKNLNFIKDFDLIMPINEKNIKRF